MHIIIFWKRSWSHLVGCLCRVVTVKKKSINLNLPVPFQSHSMPPIMPPRSLYYRNGEKIKNKSGHRARRHELLPRHPSSVEDWKGQARQGQPGVTPSSSEVPLHHDMKLNTKEKLWRVPSVVKIFHTHVLSPFFLSYRECESTRARITPGSKRVRPRIRFSCCRENVEWWGMSWWRKQKRRLLQGEHSTQNAYHRDDISQRQSIALGKQRGDTWQASGHHC